MLPYCPGWVCSCDSFASASLSAGLTDMHQPLSYLIFKSSVKLLIIKDRVRPASTHLLTTLSSCCGDPRRNERTEVRVQDRLLIGHICKSCFCE